MVMTRAIEVRAPGGPEVLVSTTRETGAPGPGQVLVRNRAIGVNFLDVYFRSGRYPAPLPFTPGHEGAGIVEAVGPDVTEFVAGERVAYADPMGAYAEFVLRPASRLVRLPDGIGDKQAAGMMMKGMTAQYLVRRTYEVGSGDLILVHAAAGGVGQILCQWAAHLGAGVIGTVGSPAKREPALQAGCAHVIDTSTEDFVARVREITGGAGVRVVYDGVGGDTFVRSFDCLGRRGLMASFGAASGPIPLFDTQALVSKGSLYLTRPSIADYTQPADALAETARDLFEAVLAGTIEVAIGRTYPLAEAARAHADLEARRLTGSTVLLP